MEYDRSAMGYFCLIRQSCQFNFFAFIVILICLIASRSAEAQQKGLRLFGVSIDSLLQSPIKEIDTSYIKHYYKYLHIHPLIEDRNYALLVTGNDKTIYYKPNVSSSLGVGVAYKWFSFDFTFKIPFSEKEIGRKGKTDQLGLGFGFTGRKIWFNTYFQSAKGLYLSNPQDIDLNWFVNNPNYPLRKDLMIRTLYTRAFYHFNYKKFSNPAAFSFQERQRKSAGSFILGGSFVTFQLRADSSLLPIDEVKHNSYGITINPGYVHTFVFKKILFTTLGVRPGLAFKVDYTHNKENDKQNQFRLGWQGDAFAVLGFNSDKYYGGFTYSFLMSSGNIESTGIFNRNSYLRFSLGKRFNFKPKGILKEVPGFK
jgi:hypothetical protein